MPLDTTKDLFYLILAISIGGVAVFLCWTLYEVSRMLHQANEMITDVREKISRVERAIAVIKEKIESSASYLGALAKGGEALLSFLHTTEEKKEKRRKTKKEEIEEE
jgi:uncharacterized protein YoxC